VNNTNERTELIAALRLLAQISGGKLVTQAADMLEADTLEIESLECVCTDQVAVSEVQWGVDWGSHGDRNCVSIIKKHPNGNIEVIATEYEPQKGAK